MGKERFRESDPVEEILRIAMKNQGSVDSTLRHRLLASAAELGISEEAALAAQQQWLEQRREAELFEQFRAYTQRELMTHGGIFFVVMFILFIINRLTSSYPWFLWPLLAWGIGFGCHAVVTLIQSKNPTGDEFEAWKRKREGKYEERRDRASRVYGVNIQLPAGSQVVAPPDAPSDNGNR